MGLLPDNPAVPIRQSPGHHHLDRRFVERSIEKAAVGIGHQSVPNRFICRRVFVGDVEFGELDRQAEARDIGEKPPQQRCRKGRPANRRQMGLDPDGIDRTIACR